MGAHSSKTRQRLLDAALKHFARRGYAGTSVQQIVISARVTKPALYYHFGSKTGLFRALLDFALDERLRLMEAAAARGGSTAERLEEVVAAVFEFARGNADLMRLAFASAFAGAEEMPPEARCLAKARRNFEFVRQLVEAGQAAGELSRRFDSEQLAFGLYGQLNTYVMAHVVLPDCHLDRPTARQVVRLFLDGAIPRRP
ncbi:MAG: TetR family transcriptional regulator [Verrucomicrobia bacterium]|jgi:AcrR family transcriptional regulator|nr:TetR family transcriptional regulator [Verrucomicrobiota bacterium]